MNLKITIRKLKKAILTNYRAFLIPLAAISIHGFTVAATVAFGKPLSSTTWIESCSDWDEWISRAHLSESLIAIMWEPVGLPRF